jgi:hypothetical protein
LFERDGGATQLSQNPHNFPLTPIAAQVILGVLDKLKFIFILDNDICGEKYESVGRTP